jgi:hypothetical protein
VRDLRETGARPGADYNRRRRLQDVFYGSDGTRTRDLRRDRPVRAQPLRPAHPRGAETCGPPWRVPDAFDDGEALWSAVCDYELEGIVAKRLDEPYLPGRRRWLKVKNRAYWLWELEREGAIRSRQRATPGLALA